MSNLDPQELLDSIKEVTAYQDRLKEEVIKMGEKLKISQGKVNSLLESNLELKKIEEVLASLMQAKDKQISW